MAFISKNPKLTTTTLVDQVAGSVSSPASGSNKIINRNGILYLKSSAGVETPLGSGAAVKNYLSSVNDGSAAAVLATVTAAGNVVVSGTFPNVTSDWGRDSTSSIATSTDNSLRGTSNYLTSAGTSSTSGATFVQSPAFNIDGEDLGKALAVQFDVTGNTTADDWDCVAVRYDSAGTFGALIPIAGIASTTTGTASAQVPTGTTTFKGFFITGSTASDVYSIRWRRRAGAVQIRLDNLIVGPQSVMLGTAITDWQSFTGSSSSWTNTNSNYNGKFQRVGDSANFQFYITLTGAGTSTFSMTSAQFFGNSGLTINTSKLSGSGSGEGTVPVGKWSGLDTGIQNYSGVVYWNPNDTTFRLVRDTSIVTATVPFTWGTGDIIGIHVEDLPITGWSSNVTMADRAVEEYAWSTDTTNASAASSFGYGPSGVIFPQAAVSAASIDKTIQFTTPILATDVLFFEVSADSGATFSVLNALTDDLDIQPYMRQTTGVNYGVYVTPTSVTQARVRFGKYKRESGGAYGAAGSDWGVQTTRKWRVRKVSGGAAVGFPVGAENVLISHNGVQNQNVLLSGTYTPTPTNVANVAASTAQITMYTRVGSVVSVTGFINVDVTSTATSSEFRITLPITSNLTLASDLQGIGSHGQVGLYASARISADTTNDAANFTWYAGPDAANREMSFSFTYLVK